MKIRTKLSIFPISLVLIMGASLFFILISSNTLIKEQLNRHLFSIAQLKADHINNLLVSYKKITQTIASGNPFIDAVDEKLDFSFRTKQTKRRINSIINNYPEIEDIRVLNSKGVIIFSSNKDTGLNLRKKTFFLEGSKKTYIGDIHKSGFTGNFVISISSPIFVNDKFSGLIIVNFNIEKYLYKLLTNKSGLGETGESYLVNSKLYMISPSMFADKVVLKTKVNTHNVNSCFNKDIEKGFSKKTTQEAISYTNYSAKVVIGVHHYIPETQWCLIAEIDKKEAYKQVNAQTFMLVVIFVVLLIVMIIAAILISRNISLPIKNLHKGIKKIIRGELDIKVGLKTDDEIGELSRAFDFMAEKLKKTEKKISHYTHKLESTVQERTFELKQQLEKADIQNKEYTALNEEYTTLNEELFFAKEKAEKSEAKIRSIFRSAPTGIGVVSNRIILQVNKQFCKITGYTANELVNQNAQIIYPTKQEFEYVGKEKYEQIQKHGTGTVETQFKRKDGKLVDILMSSTPIDLNDLSKGVTFTALDITNRKNLEQKLKEQYTKLNTILNAFKDGIYLCNSDYEIQYLNPVMVKEIGYDAIGEKCHKALYNNEKPCKWCYFDKIKTGEDSIFIEVERNKKYYTVGSILLEGNSKVTIYQDISKQKEMDKAMLNAIINTEEKERSRLAKDLHDGLGPLLSTIKLYNQWMQNPDKKTSQEFILNKATDAIEEAIKSVKEISANLSPHVLANYGISIAIKSFIDKLNILNQIKIVFETNMEKKLKEPIIETTLYRVFTECVNNTLKYAKADKIQISLYQQKNKIKMKYSDNGIGFDVNKELEKPSGLGLNNIINRIETINGQVDISSDKNKGTEIRITI